MMNKRFPWTTTGFRLALVLGCFFLLAVKAAAGVMVAPTVVFMSDQKRTDRIIVKNPSDAPTEVTIRISYGLPMSDSLGNIAISLADSSVSDSKSAMDWIRAFPRKVMVPAQGSQTVRLVARPPQGLVDGEYWARIVVSSKEGETVLPATDVEGQISTSLNMIMQMAIMVKYRTGDLVSSLDLLSARAVQADNKVHVLVDMSSLGNTSYMGVIKTRLIDADGQEMSINSTNLAVYDRLRRRIELGIAPDQEFKKPLRVDLEITPDGRNDVPPEDMIKGNKISQLVAVE
ncbi:MAG: hypothetical protein KOO62_05555 [candidate division Zixibacteria bacterium]|nr:hypothetical protein [candidate division Zixibacteria bacterium]